MAILVAHNPTDESGAYFRNIDGWWKALADFVIDNCPHLLRDVGGWYANYGHAVDADIANAIADKLHQLLEQGIVKARQVEFELSYPPAVCNSCSGTGMKNKTEPCQVCRGRGNLNVSSFTVENVRAFVKFAKNSGGFDIY